MHLCTYTHAYVHILFEPLSHIHLKYVVKIDEACDYTKIYTRGFECIFCPIFSLYLKRHAIFLYPLISFASIGFISSG